MSGVVRRRDHAANGRHLRWLPAAILVGLVAGCGATGVPVGATPSTAGSAPPSAEPTGSPTTTLPGAPPPTSGPTATSPPAPPTSTAATVPGTGAPATPPAAGPVTSAPTPAPPAPAPAPAPAAPPVALPAAFLPVSATIKDPDLGHEITLTRMARGLPWPPGSGGQDRAFELVAVEMTWSAGTAYTATIAAKDFAIATTNRFPNRVDPILDPSLAAGGWAQLPSELGTGGRVSGWLVFKVEPRAAGSLRLDYTRPTSRVSDTGQTFPKRVFSAPLTP